MVHSIENKWVKASFGEKGAQLISFFSKESDKEYIWNGDESIWKWHAPVLFPQCGNFPQGYINNGKRLVLPMHGFLRDVEHTYL